MPSDSRVVAELKGIRAEQIRMTEQITQLRDLLMPVEDPKNGIIVQLELLKQGIALNELRIKEDKLENDDKIEKAKFWPRTLSVLAIGAIISSLANIFIHFFVK